MDTAEAYTMAIDLMQKHKLFSKGWTFELDNAVSRFGLCSYRRQVISLSRALVELNPADKVKDTILHEIAHVLAGAQAKHNRLWKLTAQSIGARPERCYSSDDTVTPTAAWESICQFCKRVHKRHRLSKHVAESSYCVCPTSRAQYPKVFLRWERTK